jgi:thiamine phosphate synthase YjbQ (UPF0047 family)
MNSREHRIDTRDRRVVDVTDLVEAFCSSAGRDGLVNIFVPHATVGVALAEQEAVPSVELDLETRLRQVQDPISRLRRADLRSDQEHLAPHASLGGRRGGRRDQQPAP